MEPKRLSKCTVKCYCQVRRHSSKSAHQQSRIYSTSGQDKYREAEKIYQQALKLREKVLDKDHPETLEDVRGIGAALYAEGIFEETEQMHRQAATE